VTIDVPEWAAETARSLAHPLIFATVSGAHLYGFASADSDLDPRASHLHDLVVRTRLETA
jgi:hypothetical protein